MLISDLPCDVESEILSRVPTKSLAKLQTVCKRWNTLFRDPYFVKKNFGKSAKEMILLKNVRRLYSINVNLLDQSMEFRGELSRLKDPEDDKIYDIFHCEGLLLCTTLGNRLVVWNPCTGETKRIKQRRYNGSLENFALGYENSCHTYKILKLSSVYNTNERFHTDEFEIYEDSSDSWRVLDVKTHNWNIRSQGMSLKGKAYWIASDEEAPSDEFILSFDFTTERFRRLSVPYQSDYFKGSAVLSGFREQQLSLLQHKYFFDSLKIEIWVTDNNSDEANEVLWNKFLLVDHGRFMMEGLEWVTSFLLDQENKLAVCCTVAFTLEGRKTKIHIVGEDIHNQVYEEIVEISDWPLLLLSYVPSLVRIHKNNPQGMKVKHKEPLPLSCDPSLIHIKKNAPKSISLFNKISQKVKLWLCT